MTYRGFVSLIIFAIIALGMKRCAVSRFWVQCKKCTWFRENISSRKIKEEMDKRQTLCDLDENVYDPAACRFFADADFANEFMAKINRERRIKKEEGGEEN